MDIEIGAEARDKAFNRQVAITVVALSIFMGLAGVKDGNIVQAMQQAQSERASTPGTSTRPPRPNFHIDETGAEPDAADGADGRPARGWRGPGRDAEAAGRNRQVPSGESVPEGQGRSGSRRSTTPSNVHDDQFDAADAADLDRRVDRGRAAAAGRDPGGAVGVVGLRVRRGDGPGRLPGLEPGTRPS
ncbi:hypothetical protein ACRAWD_17100 [Caulobacter segnis]